MKLTALILMAGLSFGGCFQEEKKMLPNPEDPLPSYPEFRNPQPRYDNLADLKISRDSLYLNRNFY